MATKKTETEAAATTEENKNEVATTDKQELAETGGMDLAALGLEGLDLSDFEDEGLTGFEEIDASDISVPMGRLLGKEMGDDSNKGDFWFPIGTLPEGAKLDGTNEVHPAKEKLENVAILGIFKSRVYFEDEYDPNAANVTPTCRSVDGKVGTEGRYAGKLCAECPMSQWTDGKAPCTQQYVVLMSVNGGRPFLMNIKGVAYGPFRKDVIPVLIERANQVGKSIAKATKVKKVNFPLYGLRLNMWSDMTTTKFGKFPYIKMEVNKDKPMFSGDEIQNARTALETFSEMRDDTIGKVQAIDGHEEPIAEEPKAAAPTEAEVKEKLEDKTLF